MLKTSDPAPGIDPIDERPVGELVHQLVEDGKAYARAELGVAKAIASAKGRALAIPGALLGVALLLAMAATGALAGGILLALALAIGPVLAGIVTFLLFGAIAGGLAWFAVRKLQRDLK